ncbi:MAG: 4-hydroxy-3-methylbut-2-enyl diphosphate reductase [bacterium]
MSRVKEQLLEKTLLGQAKRSEYTRRDGVILGHNTISKGNLTINLADVWGFCYGVLYAIEAVGEVLEQNPDETVWVLGELIHNNHVNNELERLGANIIEPDEVHRADEDDVVVVPAFGTKKEILKHLDEEDLTTVDTTCPEVREVEEQVLEFNEQGLTTIIHGKYEHQESVATSSFAEPYLIVRDEDEAERVCSYIRDGGDAEEFLSEFNHATSDSFDPDRDLNRIGLANQTTMLMNESVRIFEMIEQAVIDRDGSSDNVEVIDTICSATQDRQDAVNQMTSTNDYDLFIVVGGHHSSNTKNLARTAERENGIPAYHIEDADSFSRESIHHLPFDSTEPLDETGWLPEGEVTVGLTAGASTPHSDLETIVKKLLSFY